MLVKKPEGVEWKNDDWIQIEEKFLLNFISRSMRTFLFRSNEMEMLEQYVFRGADDIGSFMD